MEWPKVRIDLANAEPLSEPVRLAMEQALRDQPAAISRITAFLKELNGMKLSELELRMEKPPRETLFSNKGYQKITVAFGHTYLRRGRSWKSYMVRLRNAMAVGFSVTSGNFCIDAIGTPTIVMQELDRLKSHGHHHPNIRPTQEKADTGKVTGGQNDERE